MSFTTDPHASRIQIRGRGGEILSPSDDFSKLVGSGGGFRGDMPGLSLLYRFRNREEVRRLLTLLTGDLAGRVQLYWRNLIYQKSPPGVTRSGRTVRQSRLPVNWRGDYARAVRVRRNQYTATAYVDTTIARYLAALERGTRALGERYFAYNAGKGGVHGKGGAGLAATRGGRGASTSNYQRISFSRGIDERDRSLEGRHLFPEESELQSNLQKRYFGEQGEGSQRILEWARERFGAGLEYRTRRVRNRRGYSRRGELVYTGRQAKATPSAVEKNAFRLLYFIRTRGTKPVQIFSRLKNSVRPGGELRAELNQVTDHWYRTIREGGLLE